MCCPAWRTTRSPSTRGSCCRCTRTACSTSTSAPRAGSLLPALSRTPSNLQARADRRLHARSARLRLDDRAATGVGGARDAARAPPLRLSRDVAAPARAGRRRSVRRRRRDGPARRRRRRGARGRLRRRARAPRDRADAAGSPARPAGGRGAGGRGAADAALGALRGVRRADRRRSLLGRDLDRPLRPLGRRAAGDGRRRRDRAAPAGSASRGLGGVRDVLDRPRRRIRVPALHAAGGVPGQARPGGAALGRPWTDRRVAAGAEPHPEPWVRGPVDRLTENLPRGWRITIDWVVTIAGAILIVLAIKQWVVNPYRIPSSSMEPTLHCARPGLGCEARFSDRVLANRFIYHFRKPARGDIIVFKTPPLAAQRCGAGGTFVKRLIGLPGETWEERDGYIYINGKKLIEPYIKPDRRDTATSYPPRKIPDGMYFMMGDNRTQSCDSREWG